MILKIKGFHYNFCLRIHSCPMKWYNTQFYVILSNNNFFFNFDVDSLFSRSKKTIIRQLLVIGILLLRSQNMVRNLDSHRKSLRLHKMEFFFFCTYLTPIIIKCLNFPCLKSWYILSM